MRVSGQAHFRGERCRINQYLSGVECKTDLDKKLPGFILLDLNMPKKDGREALKEIKENPEFRKIPIVVFTTTKSENEINRCYDLGANSYVVKPTNFDELVKAVGQIRNYWFNISVVPV